VTDDHPFPMDQPDPAEDRPGLHGVDFGDGFLAVFCERENLLAMYPHVCPDPADDTPEVS
jgi:hypothetical protein